MEEQLVRNVVQEVLKRVASREANASAVSSQPPSAVPRAAASYGTTEFVGLGAGDTIGLVIANVDRQLHEKMGLDPRFRSIGIIGSRVGAGPQIMAADEGVKATNTEILSIELPRDTKGGAGHGCLIIFGAEEVSDARRAVEVTLKELERTFGDVYVNDAGHLEFQYTARASYAVEKAFRSPVGKAFGLVLGAPAAIGVLICDTAVKAADVEVVGYASPQQGLSYTNEAAIFITGDSGAVRQSIIAARDLGLSILSRMGEEPKPLGKPYI